MPFKPVPRLASSNYVGVHRYFLTICTADRARFFVADDTVALVTSELARTADIEQFTVIAYCFMPDHLHVLVEGTSDSCETRRLSLLRLIDDGPERSSVFNTDLEADLKVGLYAHLRSLALTMKSKIED